MPDPKTAKKTKFQSKSGVPVRILFMGTPDFAVTVLQALFDQFPIRANGKIVIVGVITQPDRPMGREQKPTSPPVKLLAEKCRIPVLQPENLRDPAVIEQIRGLKPDLVIVAAYGQIIPKVILDIPNYGAINVHASLLPKHRGASPIQDAIAAGEGETGVTIMLMDEKMDHGPILTQESVKIAPDETSQTLFVKLAALGAQLLVRTIPQWIGREITPSEQAHDQATYCKILTREDGRIDWREPAEVIERKIRAYTPWPGAWTNWHDKRINILRASVSELRSSGNLQPGAVVKTLSGFAVQCGQAVLEIIKLQPEGKKQMNAADFLRGHPEIIDSTMG